MEIFNALRATYCDKIGVEYIEFTTTDFEAWLQKKIEPTQLKNPFTVEQKQLILQSLSKAELLEAFLHTKYVGQKRFSLQGGETFIPMLEAIMDTGSKLGMESCVIGMAHRGRLNVLSNVLNKSYKELFEDFEEIHTPDSAEGSGDVKYHKGYSSVIKSQDVAIQYTLRSLTIPVI